MKKYKTVIVISIIIMVGLILAVVLLERRPLDISYAYPRFDGWDCLNMSTPEFTDKEWQYKSPLAYKSNDDVEISLRNKFGTDDEIYSAQVRVITPNNENFFATGILQRDKTLSIHFPADFGSQQELQQGLYTYEWKIDGKFVLCSGFMVNPPARVKPIYRYEISHYKVQYLPSFLGNSDCDTVRIAGQVHNNIVLFDDAIEGLKIQLSGNGVEMSSITGDKKEYGRGGYEFILLKQMSGAIYYLQVFDSNGRVASKKTPLTVFTGCDKNLALVNFEQVIFGQ